MKNESKLETIAMVLAVSGIATLPLGGKLSPIPLNCSELFLFCAAALLSPLAYRDLKSGKIFTAHALVLPLLVISCISAFGALDYKEALKEIIQLFLFCVCGIWVYSKVLSKSTWHQEIRMACLVTAILGCIGVLYIEHRHPDIFLTRFGFTVPVILSCWVVSGIGLLIPGKSSIYSRWILGAFLFIFPVLYVYTCSHHLPPEAGAVPERYTEAYAAISSLADSPLLGVGPGNYQLRIGEYYQGMPKFNTIEPGTRIGYTVLLASLGGVGLSCFLYWWYGLWRIAQRSHRMVLLLILGIGFLSPLLVSQMLMPLCVLHSLIISNKEFAYA